MNTSAREPSPSADAATPKSAATEMRFAPQGAAKARPATTEELLDSIVDSLSRIPPDERLYVHKQSPANNYHWTLAVGPMVRAGELLDALKLAVAVRKAITADGAPSASTTDADRDPGTSQ